MPARRSRLLIAAHVIALLTACSRAAPAGPVRTADQARAIAQRALSSARLDEEVVSTERQDGAWIVTTRFRDTPVAGHLVTVDAASGRTSFERYRTIELGGPP